MKKLEIETYFKTLIIPFLLFILNCSNEDASTFHHHIQNGPTPWTDNEFDRSEHKFTFAVFADLNGGEREKVFEVAVAQLSLLHPEFILSLGDLIDGGTENRETLKDEWDFFDQRAKDALVPVFYVGGNHDLTNATMRDVWTKRYGFPYYHFVYRNVLFLILDSEDYSEERMQEIYFARAEYLNTRDSLTPEQVQETAYMNMPERRTGDIGLKQSKYFQNVLADHSDVDWTFVFMHKPVWLKNNEPEFAAIESALSDRPYTLFNGHFHSYSHKTRNGRDYIMLGTTGGGQNANDPSSFDHVTLVTMTKDGPSIASLKLGGILDKTGLIPAGGNKLCFQSSDCG
jgi:predicted MPP superfamily phosphohydrolase